MPLRPMFTLYPLRRCHHPSKTNRINESLEKTRPVKRIQIRSTLAINHLELSGEFGGRNPLYSEPRDQLLEPRHPEGNIGGL